MSKPTTTTATTTTTAPPVAAAPPVLAVTTAINPPPYYNKPAFNKNGMEYIRLGNTGTVVSRICLGVMLYATLKQGEKKMAEFVLTNGDAEAMIHQALNSGINFIDTAEMYSEGLSEELLGSALKKYLSSGTNKLKREDLVISTKIMPARTIFPTEFGGLQKGLSRKAIFSAVENSLARLGLEYIDLYFIHRYDANTSPEETMHALHDLVTAGKIRYLGASSMFLWQFNKLQTVAKENGWTKFTVMQNHYNAIYREDEREMIPYCRDTGVTLMPYSPLASGVLSRAPNSTPESIRAKNDHFQKWKYYKTGDDEIVTAVAEVAKERGISQAIVALAWVLSKPGVAAPIIGASKASHISDAIAALQIKLTEEEISKIEKAYQPHAISMHS